MTVSPLYDRIGEGYDRTRRADPRIVTRLRELLAGGSGAPLGSDQRYLDLGCGTGNYTSQLAREGGVWSGVDASDVMLQAARARNAQVDWQQATADALPFDSDSFAGAVSTLAIHHFPDRQAAFEEVRRVLASGPFVLFVCDRNRTQRFWLREYFPGMFQRIDEKEPTEAEIVSELRAAGFDRTSAEPWFVPDDQVDLMLYGGKRRPELYFDPAVRAGISSFADLCEPEEVDAGLRRLRADLDAGRFAEVAARHPTGEGDYLFLVAHPG